MCIRDRFRSDHFDQSGCQAPGSLIAVGCDYHPVQCHQDVYKRQLPHSALTEEQGSFFVYLQLDEEGYKKQLVTLGADNGESVQILSGIKGPTFQPVGRFL